MARTPPTDTAFLREVDDEVRRDRMAKALRRYGVIVAVAVVILLLAFGGYLLWQHHREAQTAERGEQFTAALSSLSAGNAEAARKSLGRIAATDARGYAPLAKVVLADMAIRDGKPGDASAQFMAVARDDATPQSIRDLAMVRGTTLAFDVLGPQDVIRRMAPLTGLGRPWAGTAGELTALAQLKLGQNKQAGATLATIAKDPTVPRTLRERAGQLANDLGQDVSVGDSAAAS